MGKVIFLTFKNAVDFKSQYTGLTMTNIQIYVELQIVEVQTDDGAMEDVCI